ncbi:MAG: hypothetical protein WCA22_22615 [Candidatus Binatus sp.]
MAEGSAKLGERGDRRQWIAVWLGLAIVTLLAIHRLRDFPYHLSWSAAYAGIRAVLPVTAWAALKVWIFWAWSAAILAGFALKLDSELEFSDALLAGAGGLWVLAYLLGNLLGPIGLYNTPTVWGLLALGSAYLWRSPPTIKLGAWTSGQKLAALATALLAISYLPLQLGSPVPPFMDVLSYPSSAQRILTFHVYLPFDNDPYGCWGPYAQTPALELFYALLALGSHARFATLAETAAMVPMSGLLFFATYRLGKTLFNDTAGGVAALFIFSTCLLRRAQGMRGTAIDFALLGLGLAFFLDPGRRRLLMALGAAMLGTAVAAHAIDGGFAMVAASAALLFWILEGDFQRVEAGMMSLAGATLMALPEFAIGMARPLRYPILPLCLIAGVVLIVAGVNRLRDDSPTRDRARLRGLNVALIAVFILAVLYRHAVEPYSLYAQVAGNLPMLTLFCFAGLVGAAGTIYGEGASAMPYAAIVVVALSLGIVGEYLDAILRPISHSATTGMMVSDLRIKLWDYWIPYFLTLPAGFLFSVAYDRWSKPATFFALLTVLIYPWNQIKDPVDYDSVEHSITEQWAFNLQTAADGYWSGHSDRRWTFGNEEMPLIAKLQEEIRAGRITTATHILHICNDISSWSLVQFPVLTGINDDPLEYNHDANNLWEGGSRVGGLPDLPAALAARPPYILEQVPPRPPLGDPPAGYDLILTSGYIRLYRRHDLTATPAHSHFIYNNLLAIASIIGIIIVMRRRRP